jgi:hypothetical protein
LDEVFPLVLRHASNRSFETWGPDDYDVMQRQARRPHLQAEGWHSPRIPWMWTITGAVVMPDLPSSGFCATRRQAKAGFAKTWRTWLALDVKARLNS